MWYYLNMSKEQIKQVIKSAAEKASDMSEVERLLLFGSYLEGSPRPDSDVDVLVEFAPSAKVGFFKIYDVQKSMEKALGRKVDLLTTNQLSRHFRDKVLKQAELIYENER